MPFGLKLSSKKRSAKPKTPWIESLTKVSQAGSDLLWEAFRRRAPKRARRPTRSSSGLGGSIEKQPEAVVELAEPAQQPPNTRKVGSHGSEDEVEEDAALTRSGEYEASLIQDMEKQHLKEDLSGEENAASSSMAAPAAPEPPNPPVLRILRLIGICGHNVAPHRGQGSKCYFCGSAIDKGSVRFDYQFSESGKISRYIHPSCVTLIPEKGRKNSWEYLGKIEGDEIVGEAARTARSVLAAMIGFP